MQDPHSLSPLIALGDEHLAGVTGGNNVLASGDRITVQALEGATYSLDKAMRHVRQDFSVSQRGLSVSLDFSPLLNLVRPSQPSGAQ